MRPVRVRRGADQLLDEERVALGAADDVADARLAAAGVGVQLLHETAYVGAAERLELDALDAGHPRPHGDLAAERVAAVQVVGAVGRDERDRGVEAAAEQEAHQVAGRLVGPVEVLDDEEQALAGAGRLGEGVHGVEEGGLVGRERTRGRWPGQHPLAGQQTEQCGVALGDLVEQVGQLTGDAAGDLGEGEVGQGAVGEVEAVPGLDQPALGDGAVAELGQQAGLADAGVAGEEDGVPVGGRPRTQRCRAWSDSCSSSASRPTNSDVMWSILSRTTDTDISVDPVLLVGGRIGPVPLEATTPLAVPDRLQLRPRALGVVLELRLEEEQVVHPLIPSCVSSG